MKPYDKGLAIVFFMGFLAVACASGGPVNFNDGSWSNCAYTKDGRVIRSPLQVGPVPMEWTEPDGTSVKCDPIPKVVAE